MSSSSRGRAAARVGQRASIPRTPSGGGIVRSPGGPIVRSPGGGIVRSPGGQVTPWTQKINTGIVGGVSNLGRLIRGGANSYLLSQIPGTAQKAWEGAIGLRESVEGLLSGDIKGTNQRTRTPGYQPVVRPMPGLPPSARVPAQYPAGVSTGVGGGNAGASTNTTRLESTSNNTKPTVQNRPEPGPGSRSVPASVNRNPRTVPGLNPPATAASAAIESGAATPEQVNQYQESVNAAQAFQNQSEALTKEFGSMDNVRALAGQAKAPLTFTPQEGGNAYKPSLSDYYDAQNVVGQGTFNPQNQNFNQTTFDQAMNQMGFQNRKDLQTWAKANPMLAQRLLNKAGGLPTTETTAPSVTVTTNQNPDQGSLTGIPQSGPLNPTEPFTWSTRLTQETTPSTAQFTIGGVGDTGTGIYAIPEEDPALTTGMSIQPGLLAQPFNPATELVAPSAVPYNTSILPSVLKFNQPSVQIESPSGLTTQTPEGNFDIDKWKAYFKNQPQIEN